MFARYLWTLNVLFLLGFSYFVADLVNLFVGRQLETAVSTPTIELAATAEARVKPTREVYSSIVEKNIFGIRPAAAIGSPEERSLQPVVLSPLRVKLIGTIVLEGGRSMAVIEDLASKEQRLFRLQDFVEAEAQLIKIVRGEVTLLRGSVQETFRLEDKSGLSASLKAGVAGTSRTPRSRVSGSQRHWVLDRQEVLAALGNIPKLMTQARVIPNLDSDGRGNGFRIVSIKPSSFYQRIGLHNGDVIQRINGVEVKNPQTFMSVFAQLRDADSISMDLVRNNKKESFMYEIR